MIDPQIPTTKISRGQSSQITILLGMGGRVLPWVAAIAALAYALSAGTNIFHYGITRVEWVDWLMLCFATVAGLSGIAYFKIFRYFISEREKYYQLLLDQSSDLTSVLELDGTIQYTSRGIEKILGYTPEELLHKNSFDFVHPEDIAGVRQTFEKGLRSPGTQHVSQYRFKHKDGSWRVLETAGSRLSASPQGVQVIVNTRDMTERNAMADKLRLLQMAANSVSDGIVVCDALDKDMPLRYVNPAFEKMTGYTEAEALGRNPRFLQRENRNQPGLDIIRLALPKGEGCNATVQNYRKDGTPFWNEIRIRPVRDAMGQLTHFVGIKTDVTERILANQKLRESEERFRQLAENIQQVFWLCTPDHAQMVYVSAAYEKIWGRTRESLYQDPLSFAEAIHPDDRLRVIAAAKSLGDGFDQQYRIIRPDGEIHCIHARAFPVVDGSGKVFRYAGIAEDITDSQRIVEELKTSKDMLEKAQAQLIQSEKLAGIGQLAAGVAHELNNPLSGVMGFAQLLLDDRTLTSQQRQDIETILTQSQRCRIIVQNLLQFSRRREPKKETIDLVPLLKATLDLVIYELNTSGVKLNLKIPTQLPLICGDANQIQQVFLNLITNAHQAMAHRPNQILTVETGHTQSHVYLRVADTGCGIAPEHMPKIFDPFFTTKPVGQGTGLGLSICYGIVQQHGGKITAASTLGEGTTFTMELPIYE